MEPAGDSIEWGSDGMTNLTYDWEESMYGTSPSSLPALSLTLFRAAAEPHSTPTTVDDEESSSDDDDDSDIDTTYVAPPAKKRLARPVPPTKKASTSMVIRKSSPPPPQPSVVTGPAKKTRQRPSKEQTAANKRKRDEDKSVLVELRSFLEKSTEKQQSVQNQIQLSQSEMGEMQLRAGQADFVVYLTQTVAQQQMVISNMNLEIFNLGAKHRAEQAELDMKRREEREALEEKIGVLKEQEAILQRKADEWRTARDNLMRELLEVRSAATTAEEETEQPAKKKKRFATLDETPTPPRTPSTKVKKEDAAAVAVSTPSDEESVYSWRVVDEKNPRCIDLYGFTAPQLSVLFSNMNNPSGRRVDNGVGRARSGCNATYGEKQFFLMFLYYFTHYATLTIMHRRFGISPTSMRSALAKMFETGACDLFASSKPSEPVTQYVHGVYFFAVEAPLDSNLAATLFDPDRRRHGVHVHCMHDSQTHKVIAYQVLMTQTAEAEWLARYEPRVNDALLTLNYEWRMRGKFAVASTRFRGMLKEFSSVMGCLLALTNMDLGYDNPIVERDTLTL